MLFYVEIGGLKYKIDSVTKAFFNHYAKDYIISPCDNAYPITITKEDIDVEKEKEYQASGITFEDYEIENTLILNKVVKHCLQYNRMMFHGATIEYGSKGYIFTAPSGTGKSTHILLWQKYLGDKVKIICGDKPMLEISDKVIVHSTPWTGKEGLGVNDSVCVSAIVVVKQGKVNSIKKLDTIEAFTKLIIQAFDSFTEEFTGKIMENLDKIIRSIPIYELTCDISKEAFLTSFNELNKE